jgi:hypothetical protein
MGRELYVHLVVERAVSPAGARARIDDRYAQLRRRLQGIRELGYISDEEPDTGPGSRNDLGTKLFYQAQYSLAPIVLRYPGDRFQLVLANLADEGKLAGLMETHELELVASAGPGVALLRSRSR